MDRRALKQEYKNRQHPIGVFRVHNTVSDKSFVGTSINLPAMLNRQRAQLQLGAHSIAAMQNDWNQLGADAFVFEMLDTLTPPETPGYDPADDLRVLEDLWLDRLSPYDDRGYNTRPKRTA
ncbi:MAG: LuxR family transcriptional regulator [Chlorobi bacterium]|nr:LuxR family transcriptional regulator [Chlorobiota bacterium]